MKERKVKVKEQNGEREKFNQTNKTNKQNKIEPKLLHNFLPKASLFRRICNFNFPPSSQFNSNQKNIINFFLFTLLYLFFLSFFC